MCAVSMIMDHYRDKWEQHVPSVVNVALVQSPITADEIAEFRRLLERAREYDRRNNEPDCELAEKRDALKRIAAALNLKIDFI